MKSPAKIYLPLALLLVASFAGAQTDPRFTRVQPLGNREAALHFSAPNGQFYRIDSSTNLPVWEPLLTVRSPGSLVHTDSAAPFLPLRFYRAEQLSGANAVTGDHLVTAAGDVVIHPINHASVVLTWNGLAIYVDPVGSTTLYSGLPQADLILVTHEHGDHMNATTINGVRRPGVIILAAPVVYNHSSFAGLRPSTTPMPNGSSTNVLDIQVEAVAAYNLASSPHPQGSGNGYVLTIGGKRIYLSGDTEDTPEMRALTGIDVAFLAMNQPYTMTVTRAVSGVRAFRPKVVYPYHFRNQNGTFADLNSFKAQVLTDPGVEVRVRKWY